MSAQRFFVPISFLAISALTCSSCGEQPPKNGAGSDVGSAQSQKAAINVDRNQNVAIVYKISDIDFSFAENAVKYKKEVLASINQIVRDDSRCVSVDGETLVSSDDRPSKNPLLQIGCTTKDGQLFGMKFHAKDSVTVYDANRTPLPLPEVEATEVCKGATVSKLTTSEHPRLFDTSYTKFPNGNSSIVGQLIADGSTYRAICHFVGSRLSDASVDLQP